MAHDLEPILRPVEIAALRPTQITVGYREVARKRVEWRARAENEGGSFLGSHMIPAILGHGGHPYIIDHHHLVRALHDEGVTHVLVSVIADLGELSRRAFWTVMDNRNWLHPFDEGGHRRDYDELPKRISGLADDPYRSLAGELRRQGGYAKSATPYAEFLWADFLRRRVRRKLLDRDFQAALVKALRYAHGHDAAYLPGWCGPD